MNNLQNSMPEPDAQPPPTVGDGYLLPEYSTAFIKFVDDAQWHLIFENAPIVKDAFAGEAPYAIPESFGRSVSTAGGDNDMPMHIETSGFESEFSLTRELVFSGEYTAFTDNITSNLPRILKELVPVITQSMQDQGALVKFNHNANFWDQLLDWMDKSNLRFSDDGAVSFDHLRIFGQGDVGWINNVSPTEEQIERWQKIIESKRSECFAKQGNRRLGSVPQSNDQAQISKMIKLIQVQDHNKFLSQYGTPEYERGQVGWFHGLAQYEIMRSPSLAAYHQLYVKLGMHEASSTGAADGASAHVPQKKLVLQELMPISDVVAGNYIKRYENIRAQVDAIRPELVKDSVAAMESIEQARGPDSGVSIVKGFNWDLYLDKLEAANISFDAMGTPILPAVSSGDPQPPPPLNEAQRERLEAIITEKRNQNDARRTSRRRLSE